MNIWPAAKIDGIQETVVDYETLRRRADPDFANYLDKLADFDPATLSGSREETLAFWLVRRAPQTKRLLFQLSGHALLSHAGDMCAR
jgi:hypothetical protein